MIPHKSPPVTFLSTLSLRRATTMILLLILCIPHFYPRSPCGERLRARAAEGASARNFYPRSPCGERRCISATMCATPIFLSTLSLRRATPCPRCSRGTLPISIHALLAESDAFVMPFYLVFQAHFYPRSPCGERRPKTGFSPVSGLFLSTLSLRRATSRPWASRMAPSISIHALLAESDGRG